jgi:tRNA threonylcarbamoyladenosine biosynthesis protein TsaE
LNLPLFLESEEDTLRLGRELARRTRPGESIFLEGDLGAGKSTLARAFVRECGWTGPVRSPSYALVHSYPTPSGLVHHLDLYRLGSLEEAVGLDLDTLFAPDARVLLEWPERLEGARVPDWHVRLDPQGEGRLARIAAPTPERAEAILAPPPKETAP